MTNLQRLVALLANARYARQWDDEVVARAIFSEFGVDPDGGTEEAPAVEALTEQPDPPAQTEAAGDPVGLPVAAPVEDADG